MSVILIMFLCFIQFSLHAMNDEAKKRRRENRRIRKIIREKNKETRVLELLDQCKQGNKNIRSYRVNEQTLVSYDGKSTLITVYDKKGQALHRSFKDYIKLMQEESSDEDEPTIDLEYSNREDGPTSEKEQCLKKDEKSKRCCCVLI